jgi:hypothetical protein
MKGMVDDATFLWLRDESNRLKKKSKRRMMRVLVKRKGCGTEKDDMKRKSKGWIKMGCGVWVKG